MYLQSWRDGLDRIKNAEVCRWPAEARPAFVPAEPPTPFVPTEPPTPFVPVERR